MHGLHIQFHEESITTFFTCWLITEELPDIESEKDRAEYWLNEPGYFPLAAASADILNPNNRTSGPR